MLLLLLPLLLLPLLLLLMLLAYEVLLAMCVYRYEDLGASPRLEFRIKTRQKPSLQRLKNSLIIALEVEGEAKLYLFETAVGFAKD